MRTRVATPAPVIDIRVENHGSIVLFQPLTVVGRLWLEEHLAADTLRAGDAYAAERRFASSIVDGMHDDGIETEFA